MPVGITSRIVLVAGVSAAGILSARAVSIWERKAKAVAISSLYIRPPAPAHSNTGCRDSGAIYPQIIDR
jgi:hypothetical protein